MKWIFVYEQQRSIGLVSMIFRATTFHESNKFSLIFDYQNKILTLNWLSIFLPSAHYDYNHIYYAASAFKKWSINQNWTSKTPSGWLQHKNSRRVVFFSYIFIFALCSDLFILFWGYRYSLHTSPLQWFRNR